MKYTVFEHTERGTRFFTDYCPENDTDGLKIVKHVETSEEARALCKERDKLNWVYFWSDMIDNISGR